MSINPIMSQFEPTLIKKRDRVVAILNKENPIEINEQNDPSIIVETPSVCAPSVAPSAPIQATESPSGNIPVSF